MKKPTISDPIFNNEDKAIKYLEKLRWPNGVICPHCSSSDRIYKIKSKAARKGLWGCSNCKKQFTAKIGTVLQGSHIPIHKWLLASHLMCASKKGISSHQLHRMLGVTYKTAWFLSHRIREAMKFLADTDKLGGKNKVVEADETFWGKGKAKADGRGSWSQKEKILTLIERQGEARSFHLKSIEKLDKQTLVPILKEHISKSSHVITDDRSSYRKLKEYFWKHDTVVHSKGQFSKGKIIYTHTVENFFSILKRGLTGVYQHVSQQHFHRYIAEFDFRYSCRKISDTDRFNLLLRRTEGRRLQYRTY